MKLSETQKTDLYYNQHYEYVFIRLRYRKFIGKGKPYGSRVRQMYRFCILSGNRNADHFKPAGPLSRIRRCGAKLKTVTKKSLNSSGISKMI
jgi:hypothetical protein